MVTTPPANVYPIHPVYKAICDEHQKQAAAAYQQMGILTEEDLTPGLIYNLITETRALADALALNVPVKRHYARNIGPFIVILKWIQQLLDLLVLKMNYCRSFFYGKCSIIVVTKLRLT
jgi:hypothetical protein